MSADILVHQSVYHFGGQDYQVSVYSRPDGSHVARTAFSAEDVIVNDGPTLEEVLAKHQRLLPLAVNSRQLLRNFRSER
jgi:hypothetical protein